VTAKLPDWAVYGVVVGALLLVSVTGRERADAPVAPPPLDVTEDILIGPPTRFDHTIDVDPVVGPGAPKTATAFAVSAAGRWITASRPLARCAKAAILIGAGQALGAKVAARSGETALLVTRGAATALPLAPPQSVQAGERGFAVGWADGGPGEIALELVGRATLASEGHGRTREPVLAWALVGRTRGLSGVLEGLEGGPVLDAEGRVVGVLLKQERRRGRFYTTTPESLAALPLRAQTEPAPGQPVTTANYGRAADGLRRDLRVAQVRCL
jgi:serine protease Do